MHHVNSRQMIELFNIYIDSALLSLYNINELMSLEIRVQNNKGSTYFYVNLRGEQSNPPSHPPPSPRPLTSHITPGEISTIQAGQILSSTFGVNSLYQFKVYGLFANFSLWKVVFCDLVWEWFWSRNHWFNTEGAFIFCFSMFL